MIHGELTTGAGAATNRLMQGKHHSTGSGWRAACAATMLATGSLAMSGCISVTAPDKPIVIELNINIKQEVIYRLSADAANTIEKNRDIF